MSLRHCHQTFLRLPAVTILGVNWPFSVGCHWAATFGSTVSRSLKPGQTFRPAQKGHPAPSLLLEVTVAFHAWPRGQSHQTFRLLLGETFSGLRAPFLSGCH